MAKERKFVTYMIALALMSCLGLATPRFVEGSPMPWMGQEKYVFGGMHATNRVKPYFDMYTGDYPFIVRAGQGRLALYTGMPLNRPTPFLFSVGTENQIGFYDAYRKRTLFQSGSVGFLYDTFGDKPIDPFISGSMRYDNISAGWGLFERSERAVGQVSYSAKHIEVFSHAEYSFSGKTITDWQIGVDVRTDNFYSIRLAVNNDFSVTAAVGISHWDLTADHAEDFEWDYYGAHRGSMEKYPENSREAFEYALSREEVSLVETDLNVTRDGEYVAVHDPLLIRYTGELEFLKDLTLEEILQKDMGSFYSREMSHVRALSLADVAELFDGREGVHLVFELKTIGAGERAAKRVFEAVDKAFEYDNYSYVSLVHEHGEYMRDYLDETPYGFTYLNRKGLPQGMMLHSLFYPLLEFELDELVEEYDLDFIIMFMDSLAFYDQLKAYAREHGIDIFFWDFKDTMYGISADGGDAPTFVD
ncbi:MAG: glycerophosphodiester phosphodiesterase [Spirochaetota bacterium]